MKEQDQPPTRRIIERPRLLNQLEETDARTILLIAPAGYGKTTLLRQWADGTSPDCWYTADTGRRISLSSRSASRTALDRVLRACATTCRRSFGAPEP